MRRRGKKGEAKGKREGRGKDEGRKAGRKVRGMATGGDGGDMSPPLLTNPKKGQTKKVK